MTETPAGTCPVCRQPLRTHAMGDKNGYALVACNACGSVLTVPRVTAEDRDKFFGDIQAEATHIPSPSGEIEWLKKTIGKIRPQTQRQRFLDINSRNGYAVVAAKELGMEVQGVDAHEFYVRFAREKYGEGLFDQMTVQEAAAAGRQAEFVFAREVFCEQTDLDGFTEALAKLIAPGGMLYIDEPDGNNFNVPGNFPSWSVVFPPMNFVYLSKKGMSALLNRHGLAVRKTFFSWKPQMRMIVTKR